MARTSRTRATKAPLPDLPGRRLACSSLSALSSCSVKLSLRTTEIPSATPHAFENGRFFGGESSERLKGIYSGGTARFSTRRAIRSFDRTAPKGPGQQGARSERPDQDMDYLKALTAVINFSSRASS